MKTLFTALSLCLLALPAFGENKWTHSVIEGQDGSVRANYFFFQTSSPNSKDGTLMRVQKVRAVYASGQTSDIRVVDYSLEDGIQVKEMNADSGAISKLISGEDVEFKLLGEFSIEAETSVGYFYPKSESALTGEQRELILNLVFILSMQRSPINMEKGS